MTTKTQPTDATGYTARLSSVRIQVSAPALADRRTADRPETAAAYIKGLRERLELDEDQEQFIMLTINRRHVVTGYKVLSMGTRASAPVDRGRLWRDALLLNAAAIIVTHNHPGGETSPSTDDIAVTKMLVEGGQVLGIDVLDHIITGTTPDRWLSLRTQQPEIF